MRYALYLIPPPETALWKNASALIGYDSVKGAAVAQPALPDISASELAAATVDPRRYGFHLTLKAPFRLAEGSSEAQLADAVETFCHARKGFDLGLLRLEARMGQDGRGFVCLVPQRACPALFMLEQEVVRGFENFRAPLKAQDIARRRPESLSPPQRHLLEHYGYPFVLEEFRPHFSLTGMVDHPQRWLMAIESALGHPSSCMIDSITLLGQPEPDANFTLLKRVPFGMA